MHSLIVFNVFKLDDNSVIIENNVGEKSGDLL